MTTKRVGILAEFNYEDLEVRIQLYNVQLQSHFPSHFIMQKSIVQRNYPITVVRLHGQSMQCTFIFAS